MQKTVVRIMAALLVLLMVLTLLPIRSWADFPNKPDDGHLHEYTIEDPTIEGSFLLPANCTRGAAYRKACKYCGELSPNELNYFTVGEPLEHLWDDEPELTQSATCFEPAIYTFYCKRGCGATQVLKYPPREHELKELSVTKATCTEAGVRTSICQYKNCGTIVKEEIEPALGHDWNEGEVTTPPTCTQKGEKTFTCLRDNCGATKTEEIATIAHDFSVKHDAVAATCTTEGATEYYTCSRCEAPDPAHPRTTVAALGHDWNEGEVTTPPTCTQKGVKTFTCKRENCGATRTEEVAALGHALGGWTDTATCTEAGTKTRSCSRCDYSETEPTNALGHDWKDHALVPATCGTPGTEAYKECNRCHVKDPANAPVSIAATGNHTWDSVVGEDFLKSPATCTTKAVYYRSCKVCGLKSTNEFFESGEPLGHDWKDHALVPATCGTPGTEAYKECDRCHVKDPANAPVSIAATGNHTWDSVVGEDFLKSPATCTTKAVYYRSCKVCGLKLTNEFFESGEPLGHDWVNGVCTRCKTACTHPSFNEDGACETCGLHKYSFTVTLGSNGSATCNGKPVTSGTPIEVLEGTAVQVAVSPADGYVVDALSVEGGSTVSSSTSVAFTMNAANDGLTISVTFKQGSAGKQPIAVVTKASIPDMAAASKIVASLASANKVQTSEIGTFGYDVTPYWDGDTTQPVSNADIKAPLSFMIPYPTGFSPSVYKFSVYHYTGGALSPIASMTGASGVISSLSSFSPVVLFATPISSEVIVDPSGQETKPAPTGKTARTAPDVKEKNFLDDVGGAITGTTTEMLYREKGSTTYAECKANITPVLHPGTYYVYYPEGPTTKASYETEVIIGSDYTVTVKHLYGKGTYSTESPKLSGYDNVFVVKSGENITFTFTPENGYWLHEINKNGQYVGYENVKKVYTTKITEKSLVSFGFSSATSSPKTSDSNQDVLIWCIAELVSLIGMTSITWYLFRRKEY